MQGGNVNEFVDHTTYEECAVIYKGKKYFFHGIIYDDESNCYSYDIDIWDKNNCFVEQVFSEKKSSWQECLDEAQTKPIFDGKSFWEAEKEMEWIDW